MNREIKFRAWDKVDNKMLPTWSVFDNPPMWHYNAEQDYHVLQFTGLKDINGNEIYEGDVFQLEDYYDRGDGHKDTALFKVTLKDGCWVLEQDGDLFEYLFDSHTDGKVVAHIYEPQIIGAGI